MVPMLMDFYPSRFSAVLKRQLYVVKHTFYISLLQYVDLILSFWTRYERLDQIYHGVFFERFHIFTKVELIILT